MTETGPCATCGGTVLLWERYPDAVCNACVLLARDEQGREMRFSNETLLGSGFVAEVEDGGDWRRLEGDSATCWIEGRRARASLRRDRRPGARRLSP